VNLVNAPASVPLVPERDERATAVGARVPVPNDGHVGERAEGLEYGE